MGKLRLSELNNIVRFMQIDANIHSIKLLFQTMDVEAKGYITLSELNNALSDSSFSRGRLAVKENDDSTMVDDAIVSSQHRKDLARLEEIKGMIKLRLAEKCKIPSSVV